MEEIRGVGAELSLKEKAPVELDGDVVGKSARISVKVEKQALILRVPASSQDIDATGYIALGELRRGAGQA